MRDETSGGELDAIRSIARGRRGLELLVLFGSRGRGDSSIESDWDLGYVGGGGFEAEPLRADLTQSLQTERIDLVDLGRAGGLLRFRAARDGVPIYEARPREFERFWLDAVGFWCDAQWILQPSYEAVLADLPT